MFARDGLRTFVARLRVSVIKAGLRKIASACVTPPPHLSRAFLTSLRNRYSAIPLETVRARLNLGSVEDAECADGSFKTKLLLCFFVCAC